MKNKYKIVLKNSLVNTYKLKRLTPKKILLVFILFAYVFLSLFLLMNDFLSNIYTIFLKANLNSYYLTVIFSLATIFSFFFTIFSAKNALFENKDNDLLFSLPIKKKTILLSRLSTIIINNFIVSLVVIIPGIYVYLAHESITIGMMSVVILLILFTSVIPTILACLFGYLVAFITSKFKNKSLIELLSYLIFIAIYMTAIYEGDAIFNLFTENPELLTTILKYLFFPIYLINLSIISSNSIYIFLYVLINIAIIYLFITLLNKIYYKLIVKLTTTSTSSNFKFRKTKINTPLMALIKKDKKRYLTSAIYVFNTAFGVVILLIFSIASLFYKPSALLSNFIEFLTLNTSMLLFWCVIFIISLSNTTSSSISIEKKNFWILKMLPVTPKDVFKAKKSVNLMLLVPSIVISFILFLISGYITFSETILYFFISILYCNIISNFGLICNLMFPKFDAPNDTVIVKQSLSSMLGIIVPLLFSIVYMIIINSLNWSQELILIATSIFFFILMITTEFVLNTWGIKRYRKLN